MTGRGGTSDTFRIAEGRLGDEPTVTVSAPDGAVRVLLALRGATLLSWQVGRGAAGQLAEPTEQLTEPTEPTELTELTELTDGYRDEAELLSQDGVRAGLLAPFPNRVADGRYHYGGRDHDLLPGHVVDRTVYHGFAREAPFRLVGATTTADSARLLLRN